MLPNLPADQQPLLEGFLARPTDPASPFGPGSAAGPASTPQAPEHETLCVPPKKWVAKDWSPDNTDDTGFRAWVCDLTLDAALPDLNKVLNIGKALWPPMTIPEPNGMGVPVPDTKAFPDNDGNGKTRRLRPGHRRLPGTANAVRTHRWRRDRGGGAVAALRRLGVPAVGV